ncbi:uncharacterized protein [Venturia canescens]|uniref:uncharacterized protein n=1 Tax=Venturia canescens TaxID=32260 RepID=UPI001C9D08D6|nr:uncharacterized protein LOC122406995 [Venturia canescens]
MWIPKVFSVLILAGLVICDKQNDEYEGASEMYEAARAMFDSIDAGGMQNFISQLMPAEEPWKMNNLGGGEVAGRGAGIGQLLAGMGNLMGAVAGNKDAKGGQPTAGMALPVLGSLLEMASMAKGASANERSKKSVDESPPSGGGLDLENLVNMAGMFMGQGGNSQGLLGLLPMFLDTLNAGNSNEVGTGKKHDHSSHSWYMPPILENLHVMWDHFSHSELGQTLWRKSGLEQILSTMVNEDGRIKYEKIFDSFENPMLRRKWIRSMTNFIADWIAYIADPATRQRHITTIQFVANSFLKSQGYPKSAMFDATKPVESLTRVVNAGAKRHLNMQIDSHQYIKPAVAYTQDLVKLASEKGFIMSRVNANELSYKLSETINNDLISPLLKVYRAYKWAVKSPKCAKHVLCTINQPSNEIADHDKMGPVRAFLTKMASYPAAWSISDKTGVSFWSLYGAIQENDQCHEKYPADCTEFHEEEIRVTTEATHSEL